VKGDVSNTGAFNGSDVVFMSSYIAGIRDYIELAEADKNFGEKADVTLNGKVEAADVVYMASAIAEIPGFKVEGTINGNITD
jgi:hypothetical protein